MARRKLTRAVVIDRAEELERVKRDMLALLEEARTLVRGTAEEQRAESYWLAHIRTALDDDHSIIGGSMCTMQDSIDALVAGEDDE